jgi:hypothetical protein
VPRPEIDYQSQRPNPQKVVAAEGNGINAVFAATGERLRILPFSVGGTA